MNDTKDGAVILFDGVCNFCNSSVQFIIRRDRSGTFRFASLQSDKAQRLLAEQEDVPPSLDSLLLIEKGRVYTESTAVLRIAGKLDGLWKAAALLLIIPRPLRNLVYRFIARNRYRWFGRRNECMIPTPEQRNRFLSTDEEGEHG